MEPGTVLVWPGELLDTPHGAIHVRRAASASTEAERMVLVHGLGGSSLNWTYLMAELGPGFDSIALDLPGFGWSPPPDDADLTLDGHARAVIDAIEALQAAAGMGAAPVHLAGNSMGGAVSTRVASQRPDLVRTLTLVSPALPNFPPSRATLEISMVVLVPRIGTAVLSRLWRLPAEERIRRTQELCFGDCSHADPLVVQAAVEDLRAREGLTYAQWAFVETLRSLVAAYFDRGPRALWRQAARVTCPVLVLVGGRDRLVDRRVARKALRVFPDARAVFMPTAGHVAQVEYPRAVARAIRELASRAAAGPVGNDLTPWDA